MGGWWRHGRVCALAGPGRRSRTARGLPRAVPAGQASAHACSLVWLTRVPGCMARPPARALQHQPHPSERAAAAHHAPSAQSMPQRTFQQAGGVRCQVDQGARWRAYDAPRTAGGRFRTVTSSTIPPCSSTLPCCLMYTVRRIPLDLGSPCGPGIRLEASDCTPPSFQCLPTHPCSRATCALAPWPATPQPYPPRRE